MSCGNNNCYKGTANPKQGVSPPFNCISREVYVLLSSLTLARQCRDMLQVKWIINLKVSPFVSCRKCCPHMGSVLALSSRPGHQNWPFSTDPPTSRWDAHPAHWDSPPRWERRDGRLPNPGSFHSLHRSCKGTFGCDARAVECVQEVLALEKETNIDSECVI